MKAVLASVAIGAVAAALWLGVIHRGSSAADPFTVARQHCYAVLTKKSPQIQASLRPMCDHMNREDWAKATTSTSK